MPRWLVRTVWASGAAAVALGLMSCWLLAAPARNVAARREAAQALWVRVRPAHYLIRARLLSMQGGETLTLEVRGEQLVAGWSGNGSKRLSLPELAQLDAYFPVERLFVLAQRAERGPDWRGTLATALPALGPWIGVGCRPRVPPATRYDRGRGYPARMFVGVAACALNTDGIEVRVDELRPLP